MVFLLIFISFGFVFLLFSCLYFFWEGGGEGEREWGGRSVRKTGRYCLFSSWFTWRRPEVFLLACR